jgi:hypothetical protein
VYPPIWRRFPLPGCGLTGAADLVFGSGLEHGCSVANPRVVIWRRVPRRLGGQGSRQSVLPGDIWNFQCVAHPLARNPAVHLGDVFEDRAVQLRPRHAEDVYQHRPPVGGSEDVGVVQVAPAPPGRRFPVFRIDLLRGPAYLRVAASAGQGEKGIRDEAVCGDGRYLYAIHADAQKLCGRAVGQAGQLTPVGEFGGVPGTVAGLAAS